MLRQFFGAAALATMMVAAPALAAEIKPAVVYDLGGKNDQSFNQSAYAGAEQYTKDTGTAYQDFEIQNDTQREQAIRRFASKGFNPIVAIGFSHAGALEKVAPEFPDTKFAIIDMVVDLPNVRSVIFKEHEGSYLVGLLAAKAAASNKVGFVGGMDIPLIRAFACGYKQGAKAASADVEVFENMTGTTGAAWNDPVKGGELAKSQIDRGADVIYHAAGGTGAGVLQAAADAGKLGIGVDSNQNGLHPGKILTSMVKRVDVAVYNVFKDMAEDKWSSGINVLGLADGGVAWADDENNKALITAEMRAAVEQASKAIIEGKIVVHDYRADNSCPF
ncbi:BMP family lipoprotein [Cohaesibacter celericrescens]|uniref:BMP family ABC transporter substrate-binding protein n=1 Tax=Cohaesibacter celericrescens TaxID=2067669 RepID=A0A2N5XMT1_9HYPH|nr:BMP family ABC transporter substrate-binding protein [Cohaesibacter celericrescens]PLW75851.1 BMP family ABC transporter substrate-binding protein [Cohaesibacter celericrescens]